MSAHDVYPDELTVVLPAEGERRRAERLDSARVYRCRVAAGAALGPSAAVLDLSAWGVGLLTGRQLEPGAAITLRFTRAGVAPLAVPARVAYCTGAEDDRWVLGCEFARPLSGAELSALLA